MKIGIAVGSNLGDRLVNLRSARARIADVATNKSVLPSKVYETEPVNCEAGAGKFLNAVIEIEYDGDPTALLDQLIAIEESLGRNRDHERNLSRKIDLDMLYADNLIINNERLQLPHPRVHERKFVLQPLADIRPDLVLPNQTKAVSELLAQIGDSARVSCFTEDWS